MFPHGEEGEVEAHISSRRIWLENGHDGSKGIDQEGGFLVEPKCEGCNIDKGIDLKGEDEEEVEVLKHLREEVPKEAYVGL